MALPSYELGREYSTTLTCCNKFGNSKKMTLIDWLIELLSLTLVSPFPSLFQLVIILFSFPALFFCDTNVSLLLSCQNSLIAPILHEVDLRFGPHSVPHVIPL
jgi:hypothetical protein